MIVLVKNISTVVSDAELAAALPAFQKQMTVDVHPLWGVDVTFTLDASQRYDAMLVVCDDSDQAGALGYHDLGPNGEPLGKVFAKTTMTFGGIWTVTFSHEAIEMAVDPNINLTAFDDRSGRFYAYEPCDAPEDDRFAYDIDGVKVSDFVTQAWFNEHTHPHALTSFKGNTKGPFALAHGGYISFYKNGRWQQVTARVAPFDLSAPPTNMVEMGTAQQHHALAAPGSRRERRARGRASWLRSTAT